MARCIDELCNKYVFYNVPNKKDNMINIKSKKCLEKNCIKQLSYNFANETK